MDNYKIEFYDYKNSQAYGFVNIIEMNFRRERVLLKCQGAKGDIYTIQINPDEFQEIKIERR